MQNIINVIVFVFVIGSIITIHEFGHFVAAKYFGVYCAQFSIGFGPKLFSKQGKETEFELRLLPIGGFVSMAGEADQEDNENMKDVPYERTLQGKKTYQRVIIFLAGVFMNFVLAIGVLFASNFFGGQVPLNIVQIGEIQAGSPAEKYGLMVDDVIEKMYIHESDKTFLISSYDDLPDVFDKKTFGTDSDTIHTTITIKRNEATKDIDVVMEYSESTERYLLGITHKTRSMTLVESMKYTMSDVAQMSTSIIDALKQLVVNFSTTVKQLSGPAGIYTVTAEVTETGEITYIFRLLGLLSINIGIFNLLPIPGLDGYQVVLTVAERIVGRELPQKVKLALQLAGLALVMLLMIFVTYQDLMRIWG